MSGIDWSKAPEGTMGHALIGQSFRPVWVGDNWYEYIEGARHRFAPDPDMFYAFARSELHSYIENPSATAWTGAGLPPIGTILECRFAVDPCTWRQGTVTHKGMQPEGFKFCMVDTGEYQACYSDAGGWLRPIRTPEQIAAEERMAAAYAMCAIARTLTNVDAVALYDAGYRKQTDNG